MLGGMRNCGIWGVLVVALAAYGCDTANGGPIGEGGSGGTAGGGGGTGGAGGDGGGGTGGMAGTGGMGGMAGTGGMAGSGGMAGTGGMAGSGGRAGSGGMGGMAGGGGMGGMPSTASSCLDLLNAGQTTDGIYTIDVGGNPLDVYCDMTRFGGGWTQLYDQDVAQGYLPTAMWANGVNTAQPNSGQYSILNLIDDFEGTVAGFEFFIDWPNDPNEFVRWEQSGNPFDGRSAVTNMAQSPTNQMGCTPFDGLADDNNGFSAMDGSTGDCAWWAIGTSAPYGGGIPGYLTSDESSQIAEQTRLWIR